jgi:RsiW-degrading membrane proteinase PrsW (M82 family)
MTEDARYMGVTVENLDRDIPRLGTWLRRVFWVLGGYIVTTGVLVVYIASTGVRAGNVGAVAMIAVAGVTSVGWMSVVNFMIHSDFRWALVGLDGIWVCGLVLAVAAR